MEPTSHHKTKKMKEKTMMKVLLALAMFVNLLTIENYDAINSVVSVIILATATLISLHYTINLFGGEGE